MTKVTFRQLDKTLKTFGFESTMQGGHAIFRHQGNGAVLTVPAAEGDVRAIYVVNAKQQIANSGIASADAFEATLARS